MKLSDRTFLADRDFFLRTAMRAFGIGQVRSLAASLRAGEAVSLQDVVGECVAEHHGPDLFDTAYGQLPQVPIAPAGVDALAD